MKNAFDPSARKRPQDFGDLPRNERRLRMKLVTKAVTARDDHRAAVSASGAGFAIDQELREHLSHFNSRLDDIAGDTSMPASYGTLHPFTETRYFLNNLVPSFYLAPERDHSFLAEDFLEFVRSGECDDKGISALWAVPENVIHNYTQADDILNYQYYIDENEPFVVSGISLIRRGPRLSWMMVGGRVCDLEEKTKSLKDGWRETLGTAKIVRFTDNEIDLDRIEAAPLLGHANVWKVVASGLFDLGTQSHQIRSVAHDEGASYSIVTDDKFEAYKQSSSPRSKDSDSDLAGFDKELQKYRVVLDVSETLFMLPAYFSYRIKLVTDVAKPTRASTKGPADEAVRIMRAESSAKFMVREIRTLAIINLSAAGTTRSYTPPRHQVEVGGFWRRLNPDTMGRDAAGEPVRGMTWITGHVRWRSQPPKGGEIFVKSSFAAALRKVKEIEQSGSLVSVTTEH